MQNTERSTPVAAPASKQRFQGIQTLSSGPGGLLQLACDNSAGGRKVVIKYIGRDDVVGAYKYVVREVLNHHQLSMAKHPHILELKEVFLTPRYLGVVMEHFSGDNLQSYLVKNGTPGLHEDTSRFIMQQLVLAVDFMHRKGKVHRDIKLEHILVEDSGVMPLIKMRAFHFSKDRVHDSAPASQIGTALFTAPEVFMNVQGHAYDGEAVDIWACGVVLYMMLFGSHPFLSDADMQLSEGEKMVRLIENTVKGQLQVPPSASGSLAADLLCRILVPAPKQRYRIKDITVHPWFTMRLPPGALDLNSSCMMQNHEGDMAQSAATIQQIICSVYQDQGSRLARPSSTSFSTDVVPSSGNAALDKHQLRAFSLSDEQVRHR